MFCSDVLSVILSYFDHDDRIGRVSKEWHRMLRRVTMLRLRTRDTRFVVRLTDQLIPWEQIIISPNRPYMCSDVYKTLSRPAHWHTSLKTLKIDTVHRVSLNFLVDVFTNTKVKYVTLVNVDFDHLSSGKVVMPKLKRLTLCGCMCRVSELFDLSQVDTIELRTLFTHTVSLFMAEQQRLKNVYFVLDIAIADVPGFFDRLCDCESVRFRQLLLEGGCSTWRPIKTKIGHLQIDELDFGAPYHVSNFFDVLKSMQIERITFGKLTPECRRMAEQLPNATVL